MDKKITPPGNNEGPRRMIIAVAVFFFVFVFTYFGSALFIRDPGIGRTGNDRDSVVRGKTRDGNAGEPSGMPPLVSSEELDMDEAQCPVCRVIFDRNHAEYQHKLSGGRLFFFDREKCYLEFLDNPGRFVENKPRIKIRIEAKPAHPEDSIIDVDKLPPLPSPSKTPPSERSGVKIEDVPLDFSPAPRRTQQNPPESRPPRKSLPPPADIPYEPPPEFPPPPAMPLPDKNIAPLPSGVPTPGMTPGEDSFSLPAPDSVPLPDGVSPPASTPAPAPGTPPPAVDIEDFEIPSGALPPDREWEGN